MDEAEFPEDSVLSLAVREGKEIDRLMYFPIGERRGDVHVYKFPMPGLGFGLTVSKNIPARLRDYCFVHGPGNPIAVTPLIDKWLMKEAAQLWQKHAVGA
jgi:hypothetical protein